MIETREISALTGFALDALTRLHKVDLATLARAASLSDDIPLEDGWQLDYVTKCWRREVPDSPGETPTDPPSGNGERSLGLVNSILDEIERKPG